MTALIFTNVIKGTMMLTQINKDNHILLSVLLSLLYMQPVWAQLPTPLPEIETQLIAGTYTKTNNLSKPLILSSQNQGRSWSIKNLPVGERFLQNSLYAISCTDNICIAGGSLDGNFNGKIPLLFSHDTGESWAYVENITLLPNIYTSTIYNVSCSNTTCLASGYFAPFEDHDHPLVLVSNDKGQSWESINAIGNTPDNYQLEVIRYASCEGEACVGIGEDKSRQNIPLISFDQGKKWSFIRSFTNIPQPKTLNLWLIRCQKNICVTSGQYGGNLLLSTSQDKGKSWSFITNIENLPSEANNGLINALTYSNNVWIAAGDYNKKANPGGYSSPLLLASTDQGRHWSFTHITGLPDKSINLFSVACQKNVCIAGGSYKIDFWNPDSYRLPVLLTSFDDGQSWSLTNNITNLPAMKGAEIHSIKCDQSNCTALGHYHDINSGDRHIFAEPFPFILTSYDKGHHWSYINVQDNIAEMKSGLVNEITVARTTDNLSTNMKKSGRDD